MGLYSRFTKRANSLLIWYNHTNWWSRIVVNCTSLLKMSLYRLRGFESHLHRFLWVGWWSGQTRGSWKAEPFGYAGSNPVPTAHFVHASDVFDIAQIGNYIFARRILSLPPVGEWECNVVSTYILFLNLFFRISFLFPFTNKKQDFIQQKKWN